MIVLNCQHEPKTRLARPVARPVHLRLAVVAVASIAPAIAARAHACTHRNGQRDADEHADANGHIDGHSDRYDHASADGYSDRNTDADRHADCVCVSRCVAA